MNLNKYYLMIELIIDFIKQFNKRNKDNELSIEIMMRQI